MIVVHSVSLRIHNPNTLCDQLRCALWRRSTPKSTEVSVTPREEVSEGGRETRRPRLVQPVFRTKQLGHPVARLGRSFRFGQSAYPVRIGNGRVPSPLVSYDKAICRCSSVGEAQALEWAVYLLVSRRRDVLGVVSSPPAEWFYRQRSGQSSSACGMNALCDPFH